MKGLHTFSKRSRVVKNKEFKAIFKNGKRVLNHFLTMVYRRNRVPLPPRLGLSVSKKVGKAHERNLIKRRLREIFRTRQGLLESGTEMVIIPSREALDFCYRDLERGMLELWSKARLTRRVPF